LALTSVAEASRPVLRGQARGLSPRLAGRRIIGPDALTGVRPRGV